MGPVANKDDFNGHDVNSPYYIGDIDLNQSTTKSFVNEFTAETSGEYYFVVLFNSTTSNTGATLSTNVSSIVLTLDEIHEPVLSGSNSISINGSATYSVTQDKDSFDAPQAISEVEYSIIDGSEYVNLVSNSAGSATVVGIAAGTATLQAAFTGIDGKEYTKTMEITVQAPRDAFYRFTLKAFNVGNPQGDGTVVTEQIKTNGATMTADWTDTSAEDFLEFSTTQKVKPVWARHSYDALDLWYLYYTHTSTDGYIDDINCFKYQRSLDTTKGWGTDPWYLHSYNGIADGYMDTFNIYISPSGSAYICFVVDVPSSGTYKITPDVTGSDRTFYMAPATVDVADITGGIESPYYVGSMASGVKGESFVKELTGGLNYFLVEFTNVTTHNYAVSLSLEADVVTESVTTDKTALGVGDSAAITATKTGTVSGECGLDITAVESSDNGVVRAFLGDSGVTVTAVGAGSADVTVTYTVANGVSRSKTLSYTVTQASTLTYNFNTLAFTDGVDEDGKLYHVYQDSRFTTEYLENVPYLTDYAYKNPATTDLWAMVSYSSNVDFYYYSESTNSYLDANCMRFALNGNYGDVAFFTNNGDGTYTRGTRQAPYIIMKINVPAAGVYNLNLSAGSTSKTSANYKVYICAADGDITDNGLSLMTDSNYIGNMDATANVSGDLKNPFTAAQSGDYYVTILMDMDGTNYSCCSTMNTYLKSLTLTPIVEDVDRDKVQQSATLSDRITMDFVVTPSGSLIAGYDITFGDAKWQAKLGTDDENGVISFSVGLDANQMYRPIGLQAVDANGDAIGELREYTLGKYLLSIINSTEQEMEDWGITEADKTMAKYTYNYCAKAQIDANKDVEKLDNSITVEIAEPDIWTGTTADIVSGDTTGIKAKSATLLLGYTLTQRVYFELGEGADLADYVFTVDGASVVAKSEGGKYFVDIEGINPQMCGTDRVVKVTKNGAGELTVTYSPLDYIQRTYHSTTNETQKDLVLALYGYYLAAADFV